MNNQVESHRQEAVIQALTINTAVINPTTAAYTPPSTPGFRNKRGSHLSFNANSIPFFNQTKQFAKLKSLDKSKSYALNILAKIDRGFFLADGEWTCYRRNYFQLGVSFTAIDQHGVGLMEDFKGWIETDDGQSMQIIGIAVGVGARSMDRKIDLVQHTPKRDKGPQIVPTVRALAAGGNPYMCNGIEPSPGVSIFERMQFKTSTANNGKRRAAQQFYTLAVELYGIRGDGGLVQIAIAESCQLVVRGRSPGHYVGCKGLRVGGSAGAASPGFEATSPAGSPIYASFQSPGAFSPAAMFCYTPESTFNIGVSTGGSRDDQQQMMSVYQQQMQVFGEWAAPDSPDTVYFGEEFADIDPVTCYSPVGSGVSLSAGPLTPPNFVASVNSVAKYEWDKIFGGEPM